MTAFFLMHLSFFSIIFSQNSISGAGEIKDTIYVQQMLDSLLVLEKIKWAARPKHNYANQRVRDVATLENGRVTKLAMRSDVMIGEVPPQIWNLTALKYLGLGSGSFPTLSSKIKDLKFLEEIHAGGCGLKALPKEIVTLTNLKVLDFFGGQLKSLPAGIGQLVRLTTLELSYNQFEKLPEEIGNLKMLKVIKLENNKLTSLPKSIGGLENLELLELRGNRLIGLPEEFGRLKLLKVLVLEENNLQKLPQNFGDLEKLERLRLMQNNIQTLPESFGKLKNLKFLDLTHNRLVRLPKSFGNFQYLDTLFCGDNSLTSLPDSIGTLQKLSIIELNSNRLKKIPGNFSGLKSLKHVYLGNNSLTVFPDALASMKGLTLLDLRNNKLASIPDTIRSLKELTFLGLWGNRVSTISPAITGIQKCWLEITENSLCKLPCSVYDWVSQHVGKGDEDWNVRQSCGGRTTQRLDCSASAAKAAGDTLWDKSIKEEIRVGVTVSPNPFSQSTNILYGFYRSQMVQITILNINGQEVRQLQSGWKSRGNHATFWDGKGGGGNSLPGGIYFIRYKVSTGNRKVLIKQLTFVK